MIELVVRVLAKRRLYRDNARRQRRRREQEDHDVRRAAHVAYEQQHRDERLRLGRELLAEVPRFIKTIEAKWAFGSYGRWWLCGWGWLYVDQEGRLWKWTEKHWFHVPPDKLMDAPETLAASVPTGVLRAALRGIRRTRSAFWWRAFLEEVLHRLGQRGHAV